MNRLRDFWKPILAAAVVVALILGGVSYCAGRHKRGHTVARVQTQLGQSRTQSAQDAGVVLDRAHASASASEQLSRETADVIQQAPGADVRLDPRLNSAARERLCLRPAYRGRPECVQQPDRAEPAR